MAHIKIKIPKKLILIIAMFIGVGLAIMLALPVFVGCISIIYNITNGVPLKDIQFIPNSFACFQLATVATALGGFTLWFAARPGTKQINIHKDSTDQWSIRGITIIGKFLLFSAACFTLFGLLSPALPEVIGQPGFYNESIKWFALGSLMFGSISLAIVLPFIIVEIWTWE